MDDIDQFISRYALELRDSDLEFTRNYLSGLSKDKFDEIKTQFAHQQKFTTNYNESRPALTKAWDAIKKSTSETSVLIYIYNLTQKTFSLTGSSWDTSEFELKNLDLKPADCIPLLLQGERLRQISSGKQVFRSSQINHELTYQSSDYAFNFSTSSKLFTQYETFSFSHSPKLSRQYNTHSIGNSELWLETTLEHKQDASPYSYALSIIVRDPF